MSTQNSLNQLREAFHIPDSVTIITARTFFPSPQPSPAQSPNYQINQTITADPELYRSALGTPVYTNLEIVGGIYPGDTPGVFKQYPSLTLDAVLLTVSQAKKIIKTEIQGRDGTVKEYIGMDDYQVVINGIITGPNGSYPLDDVANLKKVLDANVPISVASRFLTMLDIHSLVVDSYTLEQKEGGYSYQTFSINAISDVPVELQIINS